MTTAATRLPEVTGPVTGGRHGWPFGRPVDDLDHHGYREDEFFIEGRAHRYQLTSGTLSTDGRWDAQPVQPLIEFAGKPPVPVRDEHGIAVGGIRLPQVAVPVATNTADSLSDDFGSRLGGACVPFSGDKLRELYGDRVTYLARFEEAARAASAAGAVLPRAVEPLLEEARLVDFG